MPGLPWKSSQPADLDGEYVAALSQFAWPTHFALANLLSLRARIRDHLGAAHGLLGYSIWSLLRRKRFYTLTVWEDEQALVNFADPIPQQTVGASYRPDEVPAWSIHWRITSDVYPPTWQEAFAKAAAEHPGEKLPF
jgi:hypothetical protein